MVVLIDCVARDAVAYSADTPGFIALLSIG